MTIIDRIASMFKNLGAEAYAGETVTVADHMLQTASLAQAAGATDTLVAAALLHDIGHFTNDAGEYTPQDTQDKHHDAAGAAFLKTFFPPAVTECVRLHVEAKRYLCATDAAYYGTLSAASKHSLHLQGGKMSEAEVEEFRRLPFYEDAVRVRRWDDGGKLENARTTPFEEFRPLLQRVISHAKPT
jgi:phosphonate degradation associated HDIG domain protein